MKYYAHTGLKADKSDWQSLEDHLKGVASLALSKCNAGFPTNSIVRDQVLVSSWLHDLGKYRQGFQDLLLGANVPKDSSYHKQAGALLASERKHLLSAFAIAGHHGGIPNTQSLKELLLSPAATSGLAEIIPRLEPSLKDLLGSLPSPPQVQDRLLADILIRIIFSLLVDSDGEDTGKHESKANGWPPVNPSPILKPAEDLAILLSNIEGISFKLPPSPTKDARASVLQCCLSAAELPPGLFSLRVPTGGAKTLSSMAFALKHADKYGFRNILYIAPYLTILEQTASVLRKNLGKEDDWSYILEHHSLGDLERESTPGLFRKGPRGERWDSPIVVTSNVQFWESLFSNKPGRCRKVHRMARSVIILDECQSIPPGLFSPVCSMLKSLAESFNSTIVLCTATQPSWAKRVGFEEGLEDLREIVPTSLRLFGRLKRATVEWPPLGERLSWEEVADLVIKSLQVLVIVNTRKAAKDLYSLLCKDTAVPTYHLSTGLCPEHRKKILAKVQVHLANSEPCRLVSTQVLEAGVDIDFPVVFRELAPLESVLQAAGRCNREGRLNKEDSIPGGLVRVFRSTEGGIPPDEWYRAGISVVEAFYLASGRNPQPDDPDLIEEYFRILHAQGNLDKHGIQAMRQGLNFKDVADAFKLIKDGGYAVVIATWSGALVEVSSLLKKAMSMNPHDARRELVGFQVNIRHYELEKHQAWITEDLPGLFVYRGPYDDHLGMLADPIADQLLVI